MDLIKKLYNKYKETIKYVLFGALTTLVDFGSFYILNDVIKIPTKDISEFLSQFVAMVFAFVTNKIIVFDNHDRKFANIIKMFISFASFRMITIILNNGLFYILSTRLHYNEYLVKAVSSIIVIVLNYLFSKFIVFKKKKDESSGTEIQDGSDGPDKF